MLSFIFDDKRIVIGILMTWLCTVLGVFSHLGIWNTSFMSMGPSEETEFMNIKLNTWFRWNCVAIFTFVNTTINDFASDAIGPWIQNTLQDHKTRYLPYSLLVCWYISQFWAVYCSIMSVFSLFLMLSQIDFLLIRAVADIIVNSYTTYKFIRDKRHNLHKYNEWCAHDGSDTEMEVPNLTDIEDGIRHTLATKVEPSDSV